MVVRVHTHKHRSLSLPVPVLAVAVALWSLLLALSVLVPMPSVGGDDASNDANIREAAKFRLGAAEIAHQNHAQTADDVASHRDPRMSGMIVHERHSAALHCTHHHTPARTPPAHAITPARSRHAPHRHIAERLPPSDLACLARRWRRCRGGGAEVVRSRGWRVSMLYEEDNLR